MLRAKTPQISDPTVHMSVGNSPALPHPTRSCLQMYSEAPARDLNATECIWCVNVTRSAGRIEGTVLSLQTRHHTIRAASHTHKLARSGWEAPMMKMLPISGETHRHSAPGCLKRRSEQHTVATLEVGRFWEALCQTSPQPASSQTALRGRVTKSRHSPGAPGSARDPGTEILLPRSWHPNRSSGPPAGGLKE